MMTVFGIKKFSRVEVLPNVTTTTGGPGDLIKHPTMFQDDNKPFGSDLSEETIALS